MTKLRIGGLGLLMLAVLGMAAPAQVGLPLPDAELENVERLDTIIGVEGGRDLNTVDAIGRAVLLLGLQELSSRTDVPPKVVINEAVELAKRYGPPDCYRFVNAILDNVAKDSGLGIGGD